MRWRKSRSPGAREPVPLNPASLEPLLRLSLVQGIGPHRLAGLLNRFGSADAAMAASEAELRAVVGVGRDLCRRIRSAGGAAARAETARALRRLRSLDVQTLTPDDPLYPPSFLDLRDRPYLLFAAGDLDLLKMPAVAVVGTRSPSRYGQSAARELSRDLTLAGFAIVSGMARGIDTAAHVGALDAGGAPIGILGHGIEQIYPRESRRLFQAVRERGLLLTEYSPGETPKAGNFPRRNRLITAIGRAVLVVEMSHRSGAQHTVNYALEQGKEVMAVPGPIGSSSSEGTNQLIKDGARMVTSAGDVIEELYGVGCATGPPPRAAGSRESGAADPNLPLLTEEEERVLRSIGVEAVHADKVAVSAGLDATTVFTKLLELELRGLVRALPGNRYARS